MLGGQGRSGPRGAAAGTPWLRRGGLDMSRHEIPVLLFVFARLTHALKVVLYL